MSKSDKIRTTWTTYEVSAPQYLERTRDRSRVQPLIGEFCEYLNERSLILDAGCGPGFDAAELRNHGHRVVGLDQADAMIRLGVQQYPGIFVRGDMRRLPFRPRFDAVWANASMLHLERHEFQNTLDEFRRILRPGGLVELSVKEGTGGGWDDLYGSEHPRWFEYWSGEDLDRLLEDHGFSVLLSPQAVGGRVAWVRRLCRMLPG